MNLINNAIFKDISGKVEIFLKYLVYILIFHAVTISTLYAFRVLPALFALMVIPLLVYWRFYRKSLINLTALLIFIGLTVMPFDITFKNVPGGPKIVRYVFGLPANHELTLAAERGDIVLGGCLSRFEPSWILVW